MPFQPVTIILAVLNLQCLAFAQIQQVWIRGFNSLNDYRLVASQEASSGISCIAIASTLDGIQLVAFNSSTGTCGAYKYRVPLPDAFKCRDISPENEPVWYPSEQVPSQCWITVQRRVSGSVDFARPWADYKDGFGDNPRVGNYWLGLEKLHELTTSTGRKLRFLMKAWNGSESWAEYSKFSIEPESDYYRLSVSNFSSSNPAIGDSFSGTNGAHFSTYDKNNEEISIVNSSNGGWWFADKSRANPNGLYVAYPAALNTSIGQGIIWLDPFGLHYSLMEFEMIIF